MLPCTLCFFILASAIGCLGNVAAEYLIGVGKADVTGLAAQTAAMGYGSPAQILDGIHTRLWARSFLMGHPTNIKNRILYVHLEACMPSQPIVSGVLNRLKEEYDGLYTEENVAITASHTHTAPGGYLQYFLYTSATAGFVKQTMEAQVDGIVESIRMAHNSAEIGSIHLAKGDLLGASINRSPTAYCSNTDVTDKDTCTLTDKQMTQLKFTTHGDRDMGVLNWFAVHATSLNNSVRLISGDNKGTACQLFEKHIQKQREPTLSFNRSSNDFVAAFAQGASGDVSPNTEGAFCQKSRLPCDAASSTCEDGNERCHGRGPGYPDCFRSSEMIGRRQFNKALKLFEREKATEVMGDIDCRSLFLNFSKSEWRSGETVCRPAMGHSFAAGTTDGPGMFDFRQGEREGSPFWQLVSSILYRSSTRQRECQRPKPILLDTGEMEYPMPWQPEILQLQIMRIGQVVIVNVPGELTTVAGRRLRAAIEAKVDGIWGSDLEVIISGITNGYSSYITTSEEYGVQRYEGASTIYGPHTLQAYIIEFKALVEDMIRGVRRESEMDVPDLVDAQWSFLLPVLLDSVPPGVDFGGVRDDVAKDCYVPGEAVSAEFWSSNPRNSLPSKGHSFLTVERHDPPSSSWNAVATDDDLSTKFSWSPFIGIRLLPYSYGRVTWTVEDDTPYGVYRLTHAGHSKTNLFSSAVYPFRGHSSSFHVHPSCTSSPQNKIII